MFVSSRDLEAHKIFLQSSIHIPLFPYQKNLVAHGIVSAIGYLVLIPLGILIARYTRTFTNHWFNAHWFVQMVICEFRTVLLVFLCRR